MKIKLVVFDLAGTTVKDNRDVHRVLQRTLSKYDVYITLDDANEVMGLPKPVAIRMLLEKKQRRAASVTNDFINELHKLFVREMIWFYRTNPGVAEREGVTDTFRQLRSMGVKIGVDTGFSRPITRPLIDRLGWLKHGLLDCSVTSDEVERGRPYPDLIYELMRQTGIDDPAHVMKVGDTASDIQEGKAAGCGKTVGITCGAYSAGALMDEKPSHLIDNIPEIVRLVH